MKLCKMLSLTLRNPFYSRLGARAENRTADGPTGTGKCSIVNMIHAMYSHRLREGIYLILVHRMQHNSKVLSVMRNKKMKTVLFGDIEKLAT